MKINRFLALAAIGLLVVGAMGLVATRSFAQGQKHLTQAQSCDQQDNGGQDNNGDVSGSNSAADNVDVQCGDQNAPDTGQVVSGTEQAPSSDGQDPLPTGTPAITAEQAQTAALAVHPGTVLKTGLDDENGKLVYSVQFDGDVEVKVDAMTGAVLSTDTGQN